MLNLSKIARANEWWEYKLPPMLAIGYATALNAGRNLYELVSRFCVLLIGIIIGAAYVSIINDATDIKEDLTSGKQNRLSNLSPQFRIVLIGFPLIAGLFFAYFFLEDVLSIVLYIFCWIAFSLYSIPPFRLKKRGIWGVLADASGAHLFPTLFFLSATASFIHTELNWFWFSAVGVWSFMYGLRGILWHQFLDRDNDLMTGVHTYASEMDPALFYKQSFLILCIELVALAFMLSYLFKLLPVLALLFYLVMLLGYSKIYKLKIIAIVPPQFQQWHFLMNPYYQLLLPLSLLVASALFYPQVWFLVAAHIIFFPVVTRNTILDLLNFLRAAVKKFVPLRRFK